MFVQYRIVWFKYTLTQVKLKANRIRQTDSPLLVWLVACDFFYILRRQKIRLYEKDFLVEFQASS